MDVLCDAFSASSFSICAVNSSFNWSLKRPVGGDVQIDRLGDLLPHLSRCASDKVGVVHAVLLYESLLAFQARLLFRLFKVQRHDIKALVSILLVGCIRYCVSSWQLGHHVPV